MTSAQFEQLIKVDSSVGLEFFKAILTAASNVGLTYDSGRKLPQELRSKVNFLLINEERRIYVKYFHAHLSGNRKVAIVDRFYFDVADGGSAEARYSPETNSWTGYFGGVPMIENLQSKVDAFLKVLLSS